ncbi:MAG: hypothetical protein JW888_18040 [Pirellulales bacterium]|nr:hypothetical protein [Pirellulales bacterium]
MHTVDMLEAALTLARQVGYRVREEWLDGRGGGGCEIQGQKWIFLDLALPIDEQLETVLDALRADPNVLVAAVPEGLRHLLGIQKSA